MNTTTADKCHKCFTPYRPQENTIAKIQSCECADPDVPATLKMSPGLFDFIFRTNRAIDNKEPKQ